MKDRTLKWGMCEGCPHHATDHSDILYDAPCLECDCIMFIQYRRSNPSKMSGWSCPVCGGATTGYGVKRHRIGHRPWKRLVHTACISGVST